MCMRHKYNSKVWTQHTPFIFHTHNVQKVINLNNTRKKSC
uniref:Uncharacterized protein n=1 Tax=Arundo donax TaxID=35708 RepID=A0A0A9A9M8_ARUDO